MEKILALIVWGQRGRQRSINADGSFNIERKTGGLLTDISLYQSHFLHLRLGSLRRMRVVSRGDW